MIPNNIGSELQCYTSIGPFPIVLNGGGVCHPSLLQEVLHSWINE